MKHGWKPLLFAALAMLSVAPTSISAATAAGSRSVIAHVPDTTDAGEPPPHSCDRDGASDVCRIVIHVFASTSHPGYVCDTFNDYRAESADGSIKKVRWVLEKAMKGDPFDYEFEDSNGVLITTNQSNFTGKLKENKTKFIWKPVHRTLPPGHKDRSSQYELHIKRSDGKACFPTDPIIVNEG